MASFLRSALLAVMLMAVSGLRRHSANANATSSNSCTEKIGHCGLAYQACCIGFGAGSNPHPCDCKLTDGEGKSVGNCGICGSAYSHCCTAYRWGGHPCKCDVAE